MKQLLSALAFLSVTVCGYAQNWTPIGTGLSDKIYDLQKVGSRLYAGGYMGVGYWNGAAWTELPNTFIIGRPYTLASLADTLYTGGAYISSSNVSRVYKYAGTNWVQVGGDFSKPSYCIVQQLLPLNNGLIAGGRFTSIAGDSIKNIAAWNGQLWSALGGGLNGDVYHLAEHNGQVIAAGDFTASGTDTSVKRIARWNGTKWVALDSNYAFKYYAGPMISYNGALIIGNIVDTIAGVPMRGIAKWNGTAFTSMGMPALAGIHSFWISGGNLYLTGELHGLNPWAPLHVVLRWNGVVWEQVGSSFNQYVLAMEDYNSQLFCGGFFDAPVGGYVARWDVAQGIDNAASSSPSFTVSPNPAKDRVVIASGMKGVLAISNAIGATVKLVELDGKAMEIQIQELPQGLYILTFQTDGRREVRKLIIEP